MRELGKIFPVVCLVLGFVFLFGGFAAPSQQTGMTIAGAILLGAVLIAGSMPGSD